MELEPEQELVRTSTNANHFDTFKFGVTESTCFFRAAVR